MLKELCEYLVKRGEAATQIFEMMNGPDQLERMVQAPDGTLTQDRRDKPEAQQHHTFGDIPSLVAFTRAKATPTTEVWVDADAVRVKLRPESNQIGLPGMDLALCASYLAFMDLQSYIGQDTWMEALRGPLTGCVPNALALQMASLTVGRRGVKSVSIDDLGVKNASEEIGLCVTRTDAAEGAALKVDWTYKGPIWVTAPDIEVEIHWRLMARDHGNGVSFRAVAAQQEMAEQDALRRLIAQVAEQLNQPINPEDTRTPIPVYAGIPMYRPWNATVKDDE